MRKRGFAFGFDPGFGWGFARGRRGRRVWFESGDLKYVILDLLKDRPMHGYEVMKELEQRTRGCYKPSPGSVYPTLQWLEDEGLVRGEEQDGKKVYAVTDAGRAFLEEHKPLVEDIFDRVDEAIDGLLRDPIPEVTRLVARVVPAAYRAVHRARNDEERQAVVEILKRAAADLGKLGDEEPA